MRIGNKSQPGKTLCHSNFLEKHFGIFLSKEYQNFDSSHLEFRKQIIKSFQVSLTVLGCIYMAVIFPFKEVSVCLYITLPSFLVLHNIACTLLSTRFDKYCKHYIIFLQLSGPTVALEIALSYIKDSPPNIVLFTGVHAGMMYAIGFLSLTSPFSKSIMSFIFLLHILVRQSFMQTEQVYESLSVIITIVFYINYVCYRKELLHLKEWSVLTKSNHGLKNFESLIAQYPSPLIVLTNSSLDADKSLYSNMEAEFLLEKFNTTTNGSLNRFLECFELEEAHEQVNNLNSLTHDHIKNLRQTVEHFITLSSKKSEFTIISARYRCGSKTSIPSMRLDFDNRGNKFHEWEIKIGKIEWCQIDSVIIIFNDLSTTEKIRKLKQREHNKDKILAKMSHNLRTLLNGIIGMIYSAEQEAVPGNNNVKKYLEIARNSAQTLSYMINNIFDISQIKRGLLHLNSDKLLLNELVEQIIPLIQIEADKKGLEFFYQNNCPFSPLIDVDPVRFQQILINLLGNACKFTSKGFVRLTVNLNDGLRKQINKPASQNIICSERDSLLLIDNEHDQIKFSEHSKKFVEICVEDSGIGIQEEKRESIYQLFEKIEHSESFKVIFNNNTETGLAISQILSKIMKFNGIHISSEPGIGSKFYFSLEIASQPNLASSVTDENTEFGTLPSFNELIRKRNSTKIKLSLAKPFYILVVDDDHVNHLVIERYLKALRDQVFADKAYNGQEAVDTVLKKAEVDLFYDLILMDCDMPVMNGFQASSKIKGLVKSKKIPDVKIVAITANASFRDRDICLKQGMDDLWPKPILREDFVNKIANFLSNK